MVNKEFAGKDLATESRVTEVRVEEDRTTKIQAVVCRAAKRQRHQGPGQSRMRTAEDGGRYRLDVQLRVWRLGARRLRVG